MVNNAYYSIHYSYIMTIILTIEKKSLASVVCSKTGTSEAVHFYLSTLKSVGTFRMLPVSPVRILGRTPFHFCTAS